MINFFINNKSLNKNIKNSKSIKETYSEFYEAKNTIKILKTLSITYLD